MFLLNEKEYKAWKESKNLTPSKPRAVPADLKMKLFNEKFIDDKIGKEIMENESWKQLGQRVRPMLGFPEDLNTSRQMNRSYEEKEQELKRSIRQMPNVSYHSNDVIMYEEQEIPNGSEIFENLIMNDQVTPAKIENELVKIANSYSVLRAKVAEQALKSPPANQSIKPIPMDQDFFRQSGKRKQISPISNVDPEEERIPVSPLSKAARKSSSPKTNKKKKKANKRKQISPIAEVPTQLRKPGNDDEDSPSAGPSKAARIGEDQVLEPENSPNPKPKLSPKKNKKNKKKSPTKDTKRMQKDERRRELEGKSKFKKNATAASANRSRVYTRSQNPPKKKGGNSGGQRWIVW